MRSSTAPPSVGTGTVAPSAASHGATGKRQQHVAAIEREARIGAEIHFEQQIARRTAAHAGIALSCEPHLPARMDAGRDADVERALAAAVAQAHALAAAVIRGLQRNRNLCVQVAAATRAARAARARVAAHAAEQRFEEVAEILAAAFAEIGVALVLPVRRRAEFIAGAIAAGAQLIVGLASRRILERLVGFVDRFEFFLGAAFLADVRMVFAREPAVRRLDVGVRCIRLHAECFVVILELHQLPRLLR